MDVFSGSVLAVLLREGGCVAAVDFRPATPGQSWTEPGAIVADAALTLTGLALMRSIEQMESWGVDVSFVVLAAFNSGCRGRGE